MMLQSWSKKQLSDQTFIFTVSQFSLKEQLILSVYPAFSLTLLLFTPTLHNYATSLLGLSMVGILSSLFAGLGVVAFGAVRGLRVSLFVDGSRLVACKKWWFLAYDCEDFATNWVVFTNLEDKCVIAEGARSDDGPERLPESVLAAEEYASFGAPGDVNELVSVIRLAAGRYSRNYSGEPAGRDAGQPPSRIAGID